MAFLAASFSLTILGVFLEGVLAPTLEFDLVSSLSPATESLVMLLALLTRSAFGVFTEIIQCKTFGHYRRTTILIKLLEVRMWYEIDEVGFLS